MKFMTSFFRNKTKIAVCFILIAIALGVGFAVAETQVKSFTSKPVPIVRSSAEKEVDGIPRPTDKDHNPSEPFHIARSPAEKTLDNILRRVEIDDNIIPYILGTPFYDTKKDTGYYRLFTKKYARAVAQKEAKLVKESCGGKYLEGEICGLDFNPITCSQDTGDFGDLYRTVEDDGGKAKILSLPVGGLQEIKTSYRLIKIGGDWKLDGVVCSYGMEFNVDCGNSVCAADVPHFRKKAEQGDAETQYSLGVMYSLGRGVMTNHAEAAKWFFKAAEQGHAHAQSYLGYMYFFGNEGLPRDYTEAARWFRKAAEQGLVEAQDYLGGMYSSGKGVPKDVIEAAKWFRKAAEQGHVRSQYSLGTMYEHGEGVTQDYVEAAKWLRKAAALGHGGARYELGKLGQR